VTKASQVLLEAARLASEGTPYALATVVTVERPASTRRGDRALVTADGSLHGWVGGACSEPIVVREALRALEDGEPRLVRIGPPGTEPRESHDVVLAESSCLSEGTVEVLIEPVQPKPLLSIVGSSPAARTLARLTETIGWRVSTELEDGADAVVVATMGHGDEDVLTGALVRGTGYVGLIASSRRAAAVIDALRERGLDEDALARIRSPAGLDLGPLEQEEIAVAILAELVAWRHTRSRAEPLLVEAVEAVDPVCGMTVAVSDTTESTVHDGVTYYFCHPGCRERFESDPAAFLVGSEPTR
jgi:xanthine dehydrogenase accessory factor